MAGCKGLTPLPVVFSSKEKYAEADYKVYNYIFNHNEHLIGLGEANEVGEKKARLHIATEQAILIV